MKSFCTAFFKEFMVAARETPRMYFAIFVGAFRGIRAELAELDQQRTAPTK
jgi:hypothetical protein